LHFKCGDAIDVAQMSLQILLPEMSPVLPAINLTPACDRKTGRHKAVA